LTFVTGQVAGHVTVAAHRRPIGEGDDDIHGVWGRSPTGRQEAERSGSMSDLRRSFHNSLYGVIRGVAEQAHLARVGSLDALLPRLAPPSTRFCQIGVVQGDGPTVPRTPPATIRREHERPAHHLRTRSPIAPQPVDRP
jgi:hypothetical protein